MIQKLFLVSLLSFLCLFYISVVQAQSLLPRHYFTLKLFNAPSVSESAFTMRLASAGSVSGCAQMSKPEVDISYVYDSVKLKLKDSELSLGADTPRYSNYDCASSSGGSFIDIALDRDVLIKKKIKKIKLISEKYGEFMTAEVVVNKQKIEVTSKTPRSVHMETLWFLPQNTVKLHAPSAPSGKSVRASLDKFAQMRGLIPVEELYRGFALPDTALSYGLYADPSMHIFKQLSTIGAHVPVGKMTAHRLVQTSAGVEEQPYGLHVMATLPGTVP